MASYDDVAELAMALPDVTEGTRHGNRTWFVGKKGFVWERPLNKADIKRYGDETPPAGPLLAVKVEDEHEKRAVLEANPKAFFTIEHFNGYPAVLIELKKVTKKALREAVLDAWLACAPPRLAKEYLASKPGRK